MRMGMSRVANSRQSAFEYYELPSDEIVLSVGLVRARPGVFIDAIQHVLVLSTGPSATEGRRVTLLGVEVLAKPDKGGAGIKLYETGMNASTNGVVMRDLQATDDGRVFGIGSDHCVHELVYQATESWFRARCYLYNVTQPHLANLLPSFFKSEKKIRHMTVDSARQLLYVLRDGDQIDVYALPSRDASRAPTHTGSMYGVARQAGLLHSQQDVGPIVWISPTELDPRSPVVLVAVTERGYRIYFDDFQRRSWAQLAVRAPPGQPRMTTPPSAMGLLSHGMAPGVADAAATTPSQRRATAALYARGTFLCAFSANDTSSSLYAVHPSSPATSAMLTYATGNGHAWQESATCLSLGRGGSAPVLAEAPPASPQAGAPLRPCAAQTVVPARVFLVLDSHGLTELVERRPADIMRSLLGQAGTASGGSVSSAQAMAAAPAMVDFFSRHGPVEASLCALTLAASNTFCAASTPSPDSDDVAHALRLFFGPLGGWPAEQRMPGLTAPAKSARYEALACYVACLVRPVWQEVLVPASFLQSKKADLPPVLAQQQLASMLANLAPLQAFMQRHTQLFEEEATERDDVHKLHMLVQRTIEAGHFVLFLADHQLRTIAEALPAEARTQFTTLTLSDLVVTERGRALAHQLVTALIASQSGARASVDAMAEALQARCGSFCNADDVRQYKASECLRQASEYDARRRSEGGTSASSRAAMDEALQASLRLLLPSSTPLGWETLEEVCATYQRLGFARGVVTLVLACARAADPAQLAVAFRADGCPADEPNSHRQALYTLRRRMYALALDAIQSLRESPTDAERTAAHDEAMALAVASDDALFHEELYTYLLQQGRTSEVLTLHTPYVADFLRGTPVLLDGEDRATYERRLRDLLWQWYVRQGDCLAAAETLDALAHTEMYPLRLHERIEYLALAVGNAKSVRPADAVHVPDLVGLATQLEEDLEVAQVQAKVLSALPPLETWDCEPAERAMLEERVQRLHDTLLDITTLYKEVAEPFGLLEEQLLMLHTAQYQDPALVARLWEALIAREHNASAPAQAHQAVAAMVTDVYVRLGGSDVACPLDTVLALVERYAYDTCTAAQGHVPSTSSLLDWDAFAQHDVPLLPAGWASLVLWEAGAPAEALLQVLQGLLTTAPTPWNTHGGVGFLLPDIVALVQAWLRKWDQEPTGTFPAHLVEQMLNDTILKLHTRRYTRAGTDLEQLLEQAQLLVERVRRHF
ncbi:nucleocytoplasmic transport protein [Malassezia pachydermatis]